MQSQEDQDRTVTFPVDTFTWRGPHIPEAAPFNGPEIMQFYMAYGQFHKSRRNLELTFLNGKTCPVLYSFDAARPEDDRLLINWDWLMPLFWGPPPGERDLLRLPTILEFVEKKLSFKKCMLPAILLKESEQMFREVIAKVHQSDPKILEYYSTSGCTDTQMLLDSARNISGSCSGAAGSKH